MTTGLWKNLAAWEPQPLRIALRDAAFHHESLAGLDLPAQWLRSANPRGALLGRLEEGSPLETMVRLFTLGEPVEGGLALQVLGESVHGLLALGFLNAGGGMVSSRFQLCPMGGGWIACDFQRRQQEDRPDYVMGVGPSSVLLSELTPRDFTGRALELASGIGWLAGNLVASGMSAVASDVNARALDLGRFSAKLSGTGGVDFRQGDGFSTVPGERFELIVSNPPYVQSPGGNMTYREGLAGDPVCARLLEKIPAHLAPGGVAIVLLNWTHAGDDDWARAPLSWVSEQGTRRWLFQTDCSAPADYARKWIATDLRFQEDGKAAAEMHRWLAWYRETGARRVSGGFIVIQNCPAGGEWTRTDRRAAREIGSGAGAEVMRILRNETWLASSPSLLDSRFTVPDGIRAEAGMKLGPAGWERETIRLTSPARLAYDGQVDENILRLLALAREGKPPATMVSEILARPAFAAATDIPERVTTLVRELVAHGMLVPAS